MTLKEFEIFFNQGLSLFKKKDYKASLIKFEHSLRFDPKNPLLIYNISIAQVKLGLKEDAIKFLEDHLRILKKSVYWIRALAAYVYLSLELEKNNKSGEFLKDALGIANENITLLNLDGFIQEKEKNYFQALDSYSRVLEIDPGNNTALNGAAYCITQMDGDLEQAVMLVDHALTNSPENPAYLDTKGWALFKKGDREAAKRLFQKALEKAPGHPEIKEHLGEVLSNNE